MRYALLAAFGVLTAASRMSEAQLLLGADGAELTIEGFVNATAAASDETGLQTADGTNESNVSAGLRTLGRVSFVDGVDLGARISATSFDSEIRLTEASVLLFGAGGRLEIGERMGLPDVLTGYAPNNFTFTGAEFGPASGPSLDPAGGLQLVFLDGATAAQIAPLTTLGFAASLFDDVSGKVLYVTPKKRGLLGGISFSPQADDPRFDELTQLGLTHERYWSQNVLRWGGSYTFARGDSGLTQEPYRDLHSVNLGISATLADSLMLGVSATFNGDSGLPIPSQSMDPSSAWGVTTSLNYNTGPWTYGAYYQLASTEGELEASGDDRLSAFEAGISYRFHTRMRVFAAWYHFDFDDEGGSALRSGSGNLALAGVRLTL